MKSFVAFIALFAAASAGIISDVPVARTSIVGPSGVITEDHVLPVREVVAPVVAKSLIETPVVAKSLIETPVLAKSLIETPVVTKSLIEPVLTKSLIEPVVTRSLIEPVVTRSLIESPVVREVPVVEKTVSSVLLERSPMFRSVESIHTPLVRTLPDLKYFSHDFMPFTGSHFYHI